MYRSGIASSPSRRTPVSTVSEFTGSSILVPIRPHANGKDETRRPETHLRYGTIRHLQRFQIKSKRVTRSKLKRPPATSPPAQLTTTFFSSLAPLVSHLSSLSSALRS